MVRLTGYGDRKPAELSGGQRQRVALARSIVNRPRVLLLDEPLGALDLKLREQMQIELKQIQREVGITFVYVTHDQDEALTMSDRIAVFNEGRIEQVGEPAERLRAPGECLRRRLRRRLEPARARRPQLHDPAGEDPAARAPATPTDGLQTERGRDRRRRLRRDDHALHGRPRRAAANFKSFVRTWRRPRKRRTRMRAGGGRRLAAASTRSRSPTATSERRTTVMQGVRDELRTASLGDRGRTDACSWSRSRPDAAATTRPPPSADHADHGRQGGGRAQPDQLGRLRRGRHRPIRRSTG